MRRPDGCWRWPKSSACWQANPDSVVVIDEAYIDFGGESAVALVERYPQLLVTHTLSKSRALAGLRVGYAIGQADLIEALNRVKDSFNSYPLDRFAQAGAAAAMEDRAYFEATCAQGDRHPHPAGGRTGSARLRGAALRRQFHLRPSSAHAMARNWPPACANAASSCAISRIRRASRRSCASRSAPMSSATRCLPR